MPNQAKANLSALIESTEDLIWSVDLNYRLLTFNRAYQRQLEIYDGIKPVVGTCLKEIISPEKAAFWYPLYDRALSGDAFRSEVTLVDGRTLEMAFNPIVVEGNICGISVFGKDISGRMLAAQTLAESELRFRSIFQQNGSIMLLIDPSSGLIADANRAAEEFYCYTRNQLVGMPITHINARSAQEVLSDCQRALREERFRFDFQHQLAGGELRDVEVYSSPLDVDGRLLLLSIVHDVTDRKRAAQALAESELRFRKIFEQNGSVMMLVDPSNGTIVDINRAAEVFLGYTREQLVGLPITYIDTLSWEEIVHRRERSLLGESTHLNFHHRLASGEVRDVEVYLSTIDLDGKQLDFTVVHDVTERRRAEDMLRETAGSLADAQRLGGLGSYRLDIPAGAWTSSQILDEIFGIDQQYLRTVASWIALIHPDDRATLSTYLAEEVIGKGKAFNREYRILRPSDHSERWVHGMGKLVYDAQGQPVRMHGVIKDITDRKRSETLLRSSEERYRTTFEMSVDAVNINRLSDGAYVDVNRTFLNIMGFERQEVIGKSSLQLGIWANPDERLKMAEALRNHSVCHNLEAQFRKKDGSLLWGLMSASLIDFDGVPCILSVTRDISEMKAADQRLALAADALRSSEERYRATFQASVDAININRLSDGVFIDANEACLSFMGFRRDEVLGRTPQELGFWADPADREKMIETLRRDSIVRDFEARYKNRNGEIAWGQMSCSLVEVDGAPCILSVTRNITAAKAASELLAKAQDALLASEARYRTVFQTSADCVTITHLENGEYVDVNQAFLDTTGFDRADVIGHTVLEINLWEDPRDRKNFADLMRRQSQCQNLEACFRRKNGELFAGLVSSTVIELDGVPCLVNFMRDISSAKAAADKIRDLAFYDPLTHLPNRRLLMERLRQTLAAGARNNRKCALLFVDLDHFKILNDTLGHQTGDLMLQETARRLVACIHDADTVARIGGDEFVIVLEDLSEIPEEAAAQAEATGESILTAIKQPYLLVDHEYRSTASIGITVFGDRRKSADDLMQQADIAMYQAKAAGRNTSRFFAPALQAAVNARAALENDLRLAIRSNQFVLYYQPQVGDNGLMGAETLIRWNHPRRGLLPPGEFISLAEETGLILPLGKWVLESACTQIAAWAQHSHAAPISLAVNISARQFRQPDFVEQVLTVLERTGANPQHLELELTESMLLENVEDVIAKMTLLKSHGLHFSLDDFGTGYSSLTYLKRLPLNQLKIDRSFVQDILEDVGSRAIAQSVISLGHALGLAVIAEGVETTEQRDLLTGHGCHSFQGYLYSRPLPLDDFQRLWFDAPERAVPVLP